MFDVIRRKQVRHFIRRIALTVAALIMMMSAEGKAEDTINNIWQMLGVSEATEAPTITPAPTATPSPDAFRFRDGIRWGMNPKQVSALESEEMIERSLQDWSIMVTKEKVAVSRFTADLVFIFRQEQLKMIIYEFQRPDAEADYQYLSGALCSLYGEKQDADPAVIKVLMDAVNPGRYRTETMTQASGWVMTDGTALFQYMYAPDSFGVMYVSPELGGALYQTNGL